MSGGPFDPDTVRKLADILVATGLTEIEVTAGGGSIRLAKAPAPVAVAVPAPVPHAVAHAAPSPVPEAAAETPAENFVNSPMVGIAYLSSDPGSPPFVTAGQAVVAGQTLLLIEAMKTFNQIKAPRAGTVSRVLVASGAPVEYGEPLLVLD